MKTSQSKLLCHAAYSIFMALICLSFVTTAYVVHCMEGKDRTGYVCALLEGLCGATYDEIVADYLLTYDNYYEVNPEKDPSLCKTLVSLRLNTCLMYYAGIDDESQLSTIDYAKAFSAYLLSHGMTQSQIDALILALTDKEAI